jgi:hypothetical protein
MTGLPDVTKPTFQAVHVDAPIVDLGVALRLAI